MAVLELELRTAKAAVEDTVGRFDEALAGLAARRLRACADVAALEAQLVALASGLLRASKCGEGVERALMGRLGSAKEAWSRVATELAERRHALADVEARHAQVCFVRAVRCGAEWWSGAPNAVGCTAAWNDVMPCLAQPCMCNEEHLSITLRRGRG